MTTLAEADVAEITRYLLGRSEIQAAVDFVDALEKTVHPLARAMRFGSLDFVQME